MAKRGPMKRRRKPASPSTPAAKKMTRKVFQGHLSHTSPLPNLAEAESKITDFFPVVLAENVPDVASFEEVNNVKPQVLQRIFRKQKERGTTETKQENGEPKAEGPFPAEIPAVANTTETNVAVDAKLNLKLKVPKAKQRLNVNQSLNQENHKLTEYFTIRRSERKTKATILEEKQRSIQEAILTGREDGLQVHYFPVKGRGVIATRHFHKSEFVVEYAGDLIDLAEARDRELRYAADQNTGCYMYYFQYKNHSYCIDATAESPRLGRLVNHSRCGNLVPKVLEIKDRPHLVLVARRDIAPGEEVLYDYGDRSKDSLKHHPWLAY